MLVFSILKAVLSAFGLRCSIVISCIKEKIVRYNPLSCSRFHMYVALGPAFFVFVAGFTFGH